MGKVKEAIFNAIGLEVINKVFLDLFAGSGAIGIEAASRLARSITLVDNDIDAIQTIKENINNLKIDNATIVHQDALSFLKEVNTKYDIIFLDPPYVDTSLIINTLSIVLKRQILKEGGIIIYETKLDIDDTFFPHKKRKEYHHGLAKFIIIWS